MIDQRQHPQQGRYLMNITTRTHTRCAVDECTNPNHHARISTKSGQWHLVHGHIYVTERRCMVVSSAAESCPEHLAAITAHVTRDVEQWQDRWAVQVKTLDYSKNEPYQVEEVAHGIGTPPAESGRLF